MANTKTEKKRIYISKNLREKLSVFENYTCTVVAAPTGYGKTTVINHYFSLLDYKIIWINGNSSHELFWMNCYAAIESINFELAIQLSQIGIPTTDKEISMIISLLRNVTNLDKTVFIIDDYYLVENEINNIFFTTLINTSIKNIKFILITRYILSNSIIHFVLRDKICNINKQNFMFNTTDIIEYFHLNELQISDDDAKQLFDYSKGWPFIIRLQLTNYISNQKFEALENITTFIKNDIWKLISEKEKSFLLKICLFDEFSLTHAISASGLSSNEVTGLLEYNQLIDYNYEKRLYSINPLYLKFIRKLFLDLSLDIKKDITITTGKLYENSKDYFLAIRCFHSVNDFESIYAVKPKLFDLYSFIIKENKQIYLDIANKYLEINKNSQYEFAIILCFILFLYNESQLTEYLISSVSNEVENDTNLSDVDRTNFHCELAYISAYSEYNNFSNMNDHFMKIYNSVNKPLNMIAGQVPFSLGSPSIMCLYHNECGMLDNEINTLEMCAPNYYRITNGHGKGFEAIMKAEALYNRGEYEGAEILCHKAIYMADSKNQTSIYICGLMLLSRLAICDGNSDAFHEYMNGIQKKINHITDSFSQYNTMVDISNSFLYATLCDKDNIASWLKHHKLIEDKTNFITLSYANIIYGKYLILNKQYHHFLGISGQFIGLTKIFSYILPRIYIYIYLSVANNEVNEFQKSRIFLSEALDLAVKDNIYMPFVENYCFIENLLDEANIDISFSKFIKNVNKLAKNYSKCLKVIQKSNSHCNNYGLTNRETEIAKLAAKRLSNKEIADSLFIADSTVKSNMKIIFNKLSINSRADLKNFFE